MWRITIKTEYTVSDETGETLVETIKQERSRDPLLRFLRENEPQSIWYVGGGMKPEGADVRT